MAERDTRNPNLISASNDLFKTQIKVMLWRRRSQFMKEKTSRAGVKFVKTCWRPQSPLPFYFWQHRQT